MFLQLRVIMFRGLFVLIISSFFMIVKDFISADYLSSFYFS